MRKLSKIVFISSIVTYSGLSFAGTVVNSGSTDLGIIDKTRILYWLEKRGEISVNSSDEEKQAAFEQYIFNRSQNKNNQLPKGLLSNQAEINKSISSGNKQLSKAVVTERANEDLGHNLKILAIMIDFQDLKYDNNGLSSNDTDMYYDSYPVSHYENLLFSPTGFAGPSGQNLESAFQYYQQESGESFSFSGNTFGWFTADNNAAYYGANNNNPGNSDDQDDENVGELVIEAVEKAIARDGIDLSDYDKVDPFDRDGDGNLDEPDGVVDHVMIFHSSIGEESGGGDLGDDAIWSHRSAVFDENFQPVSVEGSTTTKVYSYTVTPIDASVGVVVHEFGHVLGVPDEYDLTNDNIGAPVQAWSVMGSGSWLGSPRGSEPVSFSPYAKEYFQSLYGGNWVNQQTVNFSDSLDETITLTSATNHDDGINQVKINLPILPKDFGAPFTGSYQYYSDKGNNLNNILAFSTTIIGNNPQLTMKARWDIEQDYDYVLVRIDGQVVAGNYTYDTNEYYNNVNDYISGNSSDIAGATEDLGWVDLTFDLSSFSNGIIDVEIEYVTDESVANTGFVVDDIKITSDSGEYFSDGAEESQSSVSLIGFSRIMDTVPGDKHYYYIQLRDHTGTDSALPTIDYDPGVLVWYRDEGIENNNVSEHAGELFIGVVDADQNLITRNGSPRNTEIQLRDAAFSLYDQSLYDQSPGTIDTSLTNNYIFDDADDYTAPDQPKSGIKLPELGMKMEIITQATNSSTATISLTKSNNETSEAPATEPETPEEPVTEPETETPMVDNGSGSNASDSGSSGGSMHWLTLVFAGLLLNRRFTSNKAS